MSEIGSELDTYAVEETDLDLSMLSAFIKMVDTVLILASHVPGINVLNPSPPQQPCEARKAPISLEKN